MGNLRSVQKAIEHVGGTATISSDPKTISQAEKLILPGVGAFGDAMRELQSRNLVEAIEQYLENERPFFGICLGMQLLMDVGFEGKENKGLGLIPGKCIRFVRPNEFKIPHMGWNSVAIKNDAKHLMRDIPANAQFYFVHSYYCVPENSYDVWLEVDYGGVICAAIQHNNIFATQFHPEKSQRDGLKLIQNFVEL